MYTIEDFRKRFKVVRENANCPKRALSHELNKGGMYITRLERGEEEMTIGDFLKVCEILKISPDVFFDLERGDLIMKYEYLKKKSEDLPDRVSRCIKNHFKYGRP